jgi:hypothetical protein
MEPSWPPPGPVGGSGSRALQGAWGDEVSPYCCARALLLVSVAGATSVEAVEPPSQDSCWNGVGFLVAAQDTLVVGEVVGRVQGAGVVGAEGATAEPRSGPTGVASRTLGTPHRGCRWCVAASPPGHESADHGLACQRRL